MGTLKGGPGKTTTSWYLASGLVQLGLRVLVIDADAGSQGLTDWNTLAGGGGKVPFHVLSMPRETNVLTYARNWEAAIPGLDRVVIDVGGEDARRFKRACLYADQLVSPVGPMLGELRRLPATYDAAQEVAAVHEFEMAVLLTRVPRAGVGAAQEARDYLAASKAREFSVLNSEVARHQAYADAWGTIVANEADLRDYGFVVDELEEQHAPMVGEEV